MAITIKYGEEGLRLPEDGLPEIELLRPDTPEPLADPAGALRRALNAPIGCPPLSRIAEPGDRWVIVASDRTRRYGFPVWGPALLNALNESGIPDEDITILFATGAHEPQTTEQRRAIVGDEVADRVQLVDHRCDDPDAVVLIGHTRRGTPVEINRLVVEADRVCVTGVVQRHYYAGFTGGRKALAPGVASRKTIFANHSLNLHPEGGTHPLARTGMLDGNPVHEDMLDAARMTAPDFCVNVTADSAGNPYAIFAGHFIDAHSAACDWVDSHYEVACGAPAPVVIAGCGGAPKDATFYQAHKGFDNAFRAAAPGGCLILAARCEEGLGPKGFLDWFRVRSLDVIEERLRERYVVHGHTAMRALEKAAAVRVVLISELPEDVVRDMNCEPATDMEHALRMARAEIAAAKRCVVIPDAATVSPRPASDESSFI